MDVVCGHQFPGISIILDDSSEEQVLVLSYFVILV